MGRIARMAAAAALAAAVLAMAAAPAMAATAKSTTRITLDRHDVEVDRTDAASVATTVPVTGKAEKRVAKVVTTKVKKTVKVKVAYKYWHWHGGHLYYQTRYKTADKTVWSTKSTTTWSWKPISGTGIELYSLDDISPAYVSDSYNQYVPRDGARPVASAKTGTDGRFSLPVSKHGGYVAAYSGRSTTRPASSDEFSLVNRVGTSLSIPVVSVSDAGRGMSRVTVGYSVGWNTSAAVGGGVAIAIAATEPGSDLVPTSVRGAGASTRMPAGTPEAAIIMQTISVPGDYELSFTVPTSSVGGSLPISMVMFGLNDEYVSDGMVQSEDPTESAGQACLGSMRGVESAITVYNASHVNTAIETAGPDATTWAEAMGVLVPDYIRTVPVCADGGSYSFDSEGLPSCTVHGQVH